MRKIIFIQPALPRYRIDFFNRLSKRYGENLEVYYSDSSSLKILAQSLTKSWAIKVGCIKKLPWIGHVEWQEGVIRIQIHKEDIIVLSGNPRNLSTIALFLKAKMKGANVVWWGHYWSSTSKRWRQILRFIPMSYADALLFYTDNEVKLFNNDPIAPNKKQIVTALNNGIDITQIIHLRDPYNAATRQNALLFIGRLTKKSRLDIAISAMYRNSGNAPILHVIGSGPEEDKLKSLTHELGLTNSVIWHGPLINEEDISIIANQCKAFIYPGDVGLSLIHMMAYGLPAILHDQEKHHMPEIAAFDNKETGVTFKFDNISSLAFIIQNLLASQTELNSMSNSCIEKTSNSFNTENMAIRFINLIDKIN